jgi:tetratricopeptide (TPR) repeat protein
MANRGPKAPLDPRRIRRDRAVAGARAALGGGRPKEALDLLRPFDLPAAVDGEVELLLALAYESLERPVDALVRAERSLAVKEHPTTLLLLGRLARRAGETDRALEFCGRAAMVDDARPAALLLRIGVLEEAGRIAEARASLDELLHRHRRDPLGPPLPVRIEEAKVLVQEGRRVEAIARIDGLLARHGAGGTQPVEPARSLLYLKAKALDREGRYDEAMEAAQAANDRGRIEFDPRIYEEQVDALIANWSKERMRRFPRSACLDERPIFVAGMPRSGTTLLDQIIDAHPDAAGVGELASIESFALRLSQAYRHDLDPPACFGPFADPAALTSVADDYVRSISERSPSARRIVNKALGNNRLVGLLAVLFPRTRIIHAVRDPRDVAVSCVMGGFNNALYPWTTKLEWVARAWEQSKRLMDHWADALDIEILEVRYERLVTNPDEEFPRLVSFLGLPWDERCRAFHESRRTVRTLSYDQVNRPLYATSAGRWRRYEKHLAGIDWPS